MTAETDLRALLAAYGGLTALVGVRIRQNAAEAADDMPYVVYSASHQPDFGLANNTLANNVQFTLQCWAATAAAADAVADQVQAALLAAGVVCTSRDTGHDSETGRDGTVLVADWWE